MHFWTCCRKDEREIFVADLRRASLTAGKKFDLSLKIALYIPKYYLYQCVGRLHPGPSAAEFSILAAEWQRNSET
jgi:hypothetical protein